MVETDLGTATILYEDPNEGTVEETVENEHVAYFQDHWIVKTGEHEAGHDVVRRIPANRVYYVERNVEAFEDEVETRLNELQSFADGIGSEVQTLRDRIGSVTGELRTELLGETGRTEDSEGSERAIRINIEEAEEGRDAESGSSDSGVDSSTDSDVESDADQDEDDRA